MKNKKSLHDKIMKGLEMAYEKLLDETAAIDGYLVISENGKIVKIKASVLKEKRKKALVKSKKARKPKARR
jgi:hypothetical protein